jgi:type I restriction enzyme, S subunit
MTLQTFFDNFDLLTDAPSGVKKLRELILQLAVQGKLVPQDPEDEPASILLEKIKSDKEKLIQEKKIRRAESLPPIGVDEIPFALPINWEWVRLDSICQQITDGAHHTPTYTATGIPFLSVKDISSGKIDLTNVRYI